MQSLIPRLHVFHEAHYVSDSDETVPSCFSFLLKANRLGLHYLECPLEGVRVVSLSEWESGRLRRKESQKRKMAHVYFNRKENEKEIKKHAIRTDIKKSKRRKECD